MNRSGENAQERQELLRRYLLRTLDSEEEKHLTERLESSSEWRMEFEREKRVIEALDSLPEILAPQALGRATMDRIIERQTPRRITSAAVLIRVTACLALFCVAAAFILPSLARSRESARRASTQNNLKQMGLVLKMYANETPGQLFPPIAPVDGVWALDVPTVYPAYATDPAIFADVSSGEVSNVTEKLPELMKDPKVNRAEAARIVGNQFAYLGWCVRNESDVEILIETRRHLAPDQLDKDIVVGERFLPRLGVNVRLDSKDESSNPASLARAMSQIPVLIQVEPEDPKTGRNVLFLDGHVEYQAFGKFPNTDKVQTLLGLRPGR